MRSRRWQARLATVNSHAENDITARSVPMRRYNSSSVSWTASSMSAALQLRAA